MKPKIIFLGTPDFAVASLKALVENNFNVIAVVTAPDKPAGRGMQLKASAVKEYAESQQLLVLQPEKLKNPEFVDTLRNLNADLQIVVAFRMLPEVVWNMPKMGTVNVHASLLPQYRGAAPINWAIINGETKTGVTTFKLQHEIDTGDILLQKEVAILPEDNIGTLYSKLMEEGAQLLIETVNGLIANSIQEQPQVMSEHIQHAPKIFKETGDIDWNLDVTSIHNLIRGLSPTPAAFTMLKDKNFKIFQSTFTIDTEINVLPGTVETDGKTYLKFAAKNGWLEVLDIQYQGKKRMLIEDFLRGFRL